MIRQKKNIAPIGFNDITRVSKKRLLLTTYIFLIIGFTYGVFANLLITHSEVAIIGFASFVALALGGLLYYLFSKNSRVSSFVAVAIVVMTYFAYLEISITAVFVLFYFPVVIIITFYLIGRFYGIIISSLVFVTTIVYLIFRPGVWGAVTFDASSFANFIVGSICSVGLIIVYESTLVEAHHLLINNNRTLEAMTITDSLTGLYNRKWIDSEFEKRLAEARKGRGFSVFVIDFDDFKLINDEFGHIAGDQVLQSFANLMRTGENYKTGRWGGEEFVCFCDIGTSAGAVECAERIRVLVAEGNIFSPKKITIGVGVSIYESGDTATTILNRADKGVYKAKAEGKNRACYVELTTSKPTKK
ncbi:MAG: GGDEF domain-containing protein [Bacilli bacterium]|jgi:diguanylate cyclase (GGDEF)-like protein